MAYVWDEIYNLIRRYGGDLSGGINWTWAKFGDPVMGEACFREVNKQYPFIEHRGYYPPSHPPHTDSGFRFR